MNEQTHFEGMEPPRYKQLKTAPNITYKAVKEAKLYQPIEQAISLSPDYFTIYNDISGISKKARLLPDLNRNGLARILDTGTMSRSAMARLRRAMGYLCLISKEKTVVHDIKKYRFKFKCSFITLTLPSKQKHHDNFIKQNLLKEFLDAMCYRYSSFSYVWKAETQRNGNLHFHLVTDHFIPTSYINYKWNRILYKYGYMDKYLKEKGHINAPSAEIKKVKSDKDLAKYMRKYLTKQASKTPVNELKLQLKKAKDNFLNSSDEPAKAGFILQIKKINKLITEAEKRKVCGKIWGCSKRLLLPPYRTHCNQLSIEERELLFQNEVIVESEYFTVFKLNDFREFILKMGDYTRSFISVYYKALIPEIPIPDIIYNTSMNYKY